MVLLTGTSNLPLADNIASILKQEVEQPVTLFKNGEIRVCITHDLSRKDIFIIQSPTHPNINNQIMEIYIMLDATKRASSGEITLIMPNYPYARQDRKNASRVPITASLLANLIETAGADRIVTVDLHAEQTEGSITKPWDNVYASYSLIPTIKKWNLTNITIVAPDIGAVKRAIAYGSKLDIPFENIAIVNKTRDVSNGDTSSLSLVGSVKGKDAILTDDILQTGSLLFGAAKLLEKNGARSIYAAITHAEFIPDSDKNKDPLELLTNSPIKKILITDSLFLRPEIRNHPKIQVVSIAPLLAETIRLIHLGQPLHPLFE